MKKVIYLLLIIVSMFSFSLLFENEKLRINNNMERVEQNLSNSYNILLPTSLDKGDQNNVYNTIIDVLKKHNVNIYISKVGPNGEYIKYIYLNDLSYFNNFQIAKGRTLYLEDMESDKFLSSSNTRNENQLGLISTFDGKEVFEIRTLKSIIDDNYLLSGNCTVQLLNEDNIDLFIEDLEKSLNISGIEQVQINSITPEYYHNQWIIPSMYFIIILLILYSILKSYKKYGIQKMLGYSNINIWLKEISTLILIECIILFLVNIVMVLFLFKDYNIYLLQFVKTIFKSSINQIIVLFIIASIPFLYLEKISINEIIKNKLPIKDIIVFNSLLKIIVIVISFNLFNTTIQNYNSIENLFNDNYKSWEKAKDYYVIPNMNIKNGDITLEESNNLPDLYFNLNKDGTIMADFTNYLPVKYDYNEPEYKRDVAIVNPNYLKENIIYDINNNPISISEYDDNLILLVPEKYKNIEDDLTNLWNKIKLGYGDNTIYSNQKTKIIYTKSNQEIFSYSLDVNPDKGNMVTNSIVRVITEKNGTGFDYGITIGFEGNPIKIKVDPKLDYNEYVYGKLKELGLNKFVEKIVPANDGIAFESKSTYKLLIFIIGGIFLTTFAMLIIIIQTILCFWGQYKRQLAIRHFLGYSTLAKYKEYFFLIIGTYLIAFIINTYNNVLNIYIQVLLSLFFLIVDLIFTLCTIKYIDKIKFINIIKGS